MPRAQSLVRARLDAIDALNNQLVKIKVLATLISEEYAGDDAPIVADCILDVLTVIKTLNEGPAALISAEKGGR